VPIGGGSIPEVGGPDLTNKRWTLKARESWCRRSLGGISHRHFPVFSLPMVFWGTGTLWTFTISILCIHRCRGFVTCRVSGWGPQILESCTIPDSLIHSCGDVIYYAVCNDWCLQILVHICIYRYHLRQLPYFKVVSVCFLGIILHLSENEWWDTRWIWKCLQFEPLWSRHEGISNMRVER